MAKVQLIVAILIYWTMLIIFFSSALGSPLSSDYNVTSLGFNSTGIDIAGEIDSGGFLGGVFGSVVGIFTIGTRFFGLVAFGIGLPSGTPTWVQFIFSSFNVILLCAMLLLIISLFWDG